MDSAGEDIPLRHSPKNQNFAFIKVPDPPLFEPPLRTSGSGPVFSPNVEIYVTALLHSVILLFHLQKPPRV